jgi:pimeloyl-ACP methyl ester carboxylesterase
LWSCPPPTPPGKTRPHSLGSRYRRFNASAIKARAAMIPVPCSAPSSAAQYSETSGGAVAAPGAGPLDQRLVFLAARIQIVDIGPRAGELQHPAFGGLEFGVVVFDQPGQLRRAHRRQLHSRFEHAFNIEEATDKIPVSPAWISHGKGMAGVCHQVSQNDCLHQIAGVRLPPKCRRNPLDPMSLVASPGRSCQQLTGERPAMSIVTSADGTTIDYDAYGSGPAVILVGGASQYRAIDTRTTEIAKHLAEEGFTAVDYDRRGRGRSGDTQPWSLEREVEDLAALIEATVAPAAVYTSSSGAAIALAAVTSGVAVLALALYEPPYFAGSDGREHIATLRRMMDEGKLDEATRYNMTAIIGLPDEAVGQMAEAPWWPGLVAVAPTLVYDHRASHDIETDPDWRARWARVTVPTVVYSGDRTFPGLPEAADAVAAALPNARRRVLAGQDHGPAPEVIVPELVTFMRSAA